MQLPAIAPGKRYTVSRPVGSADSLLLARFAQSQAAKGRLCAIVSAEPADTVRLEGELAFFAPNLRIAVFPDWETLPYDTFSPHQDLISERLATLWRILQREVDVVLVPASTALVRLAPQSFLAAYTFNFKQKEKLDEASLKSQLTLAGYTHVSQVVSPGEYAVRGGLIDLFPMGSLVPYRVDLFGDEVDSIRTFDPDSQRSLFPVPEVRLLPGREFPMDDDARTAFRARWRERIDGDPTRSRIYKDIGTGITTGGIEYYLPLFFDETATLFDYLGAESALALHGNVDDALKRFWTDTRERHRFLQHDPERPLLPPEALFLKAEEFFTLASSHATLSVRGKASKRIVDAANGNPAEAPLEESPAITDVGTDASTDATTDATDAIADASATSALPTDDTKPAADLAWTKPLPDLSVDRGAPEPLKRLQVHVGATNMRVLMVAETEGRRESLLELLRDSRIEPPSVASLDAFIAGSERFAMAV
ncbi:MAG: transcription-repair coupling factor, partial [Rhizobacter sp.]|nr:transcription-repair coupling factor [Rhizobacter sp.]